MAQDAKQSYERTHRQQPIPAKEQKPSVRQPVDLPALQRAVTDPASAKPADILGLQQTAGNRAVARLIQTKLTVGAAHDAYEQEADRVAEQVVGMAKGRGGEGAKGSLGTVQRQGEEEEIQTKPLAASITPLVQRQPEEEEIQTKRIQRQGEEEEIQTKPIQRQPEEEELQTKRIQRQPEEEEIQTKRIQRQPEEEEIQTKRIQRQPEEEEIQTKRIQRQGEEEEIQTKPIQRQGEEEEIQTKRVPATGSFEAGADLEQHLSASKGRGSPLPAETRAFMEPRFGANFSAVRVHTGADAAQVSRSISAQAFTHGHDIYLGAGKYDPGSTAGKQLLAHELTHVIQQTGANKLQRQADPLNVQIQTAMSPERISRRLMHLDFVKMKRKETHIAKMLLHKLHLAKEPNDAYGHWWTEVGDLVENTWLPAESYGWWPSIGVNIKSTLSGVPGRLNKSGGNRDPHHGDDADSAFHPVADVNPSEDYRTAHDRIVGQIRSFSTGFKGSWNWRFGWGKNCHTFQERLMKHVGLKQGKAAEWLKRPETSQDVIERKLGRAALDLLVAGADLNTVAMASLSSGTVIEELQRLKPNELVALATIMGKGVDEVQIEIDGLR